MKRLKQLLEGIQHRILGGEDVAISGIFIDSREVKEGGLFICLCGQTENGEDYCDEAVINGAAAIVTAGEYYRGVTTVRVEDTRQAFALLSRNFYDMPDEKLTIIAVTGTNGKTSTVQITAKLLESRYKVGTIGTAGYYSLGEKLGEGMTTPDCHVLYKLLSKMLSDGVQYVVMEASAHAIYYKKLVGLRIDTLVFTNCTRDHLDFFVTFEKYRATKLGLCLQKSIRRVIANTDDVTGQQLEMLRRGVISYGVTCPSEVFATLLSETEKGIRFILNYSDNLAEIECRLHGEFNVYNVTAALIAALDYDIPLPLLLDTLKRIQPITGRYNVLKKGGRTIIIDYAHTPDGLNNLLCGVRKSYSGTLIAVFGCGGNRDTGKRSLMGKVAEEYSDVIVLTADNSRYEETSAIIEDIAKGISGKKPYKIADRAEAIKLAYSLSAVGDVIVLAGKGAEDYIDVKGEKLPYSDRAVAEALYDE